MLKLQYLFSFFLFFIIFNSNAQHQENQESIVSKQVNIQGDKNFRDLGGIIGVDGRKVSKNKLFRSGRLARITDADIQTIKNIGIQQIIDLRTSNQRAQIPDRKIDGVVNMHIPLLEGDVGSRAFMEKVMNKELDAKKFMLELYGTIDSLKIANWTKIFNLLEKNKPTLWHCSSGKDRVGMTTALVLASLGVDENTIVKDFMVSNHYLEQNHNRTLAAFEQRNGKEIKDLISPLLILDELYIHTFLNSIKKKYGSIHKFLKILDVDIDKMRENFLEKS